MKNPKYARNVDPSHEVDGRQRIAGPVWIDGEDLGDDAEKFDVPRKKGRYRANF